MAVHRSAPKAAKPISVNSESAATNTAAMCSVPPPFHSRIAARAALTWFCSPPPIVDRP